MQFDQFRFLNLSYRVPKTILKVGSVGALCPHNTASFVIQFEALCGARSETQIGQIICHGRTCPIYFIIQNQFVKYFNYSIDFSLLSYPSRQQTNDHHNNQLPTIKAQLIIWFLNIKKQGPLAEFFLIKQCFQIFWKPRCRNHNQMYNLCIFLIH